jgi:tight adherence protein B
MSGEAAGWSLLCVVLAAASVWLWPGPPTTAGLRIHPRRGADGRPRPPGRDRSSRTRGSPVFRRRPTGRRDRSDPTDDLALLLELLEGPLRAGVDPRRALHLTAAALADRGDVQDLVLTLGGGRSKGRWPVGRGREPVGSEALVAAAWQLSEQSGVPLAVAVRAAARALRARQSSARALASATAGATASMRLLAALPAAGPLVGLLFGVGPKELYASTPAATLCLLAGTGLGLGGWWWSRSILRRAASPREVR